MDLPLLQWLEKYTFPSETRFKDLDHARTVYASSVARHLRCGTTTCSYFATIHLEATKVLVDVVRELGQRAYVGKVSMDRNSPEDYTETTERGIWEAGEFADFVLKEGAEEESEGGGKGLLTGRDDDDDDDSDGLLVPVRIPPPPPPPLVTPVVTPRFVPTCSSAMMRGLGDLSESKSLPVQSHLSENVGEISWVQELHPDCSSYTQVYDRHGLLHERSYMAHCVHCSSDERALLKHTGTGVIHCPNSNFALGSGIMNARRMLNEGVKLGLGTDVAGGYAFSMLDAIRQCIIASKSISFVASAEGEDGGAFDPLTYAEAFHLATLGSAEVLGLADLVGNFAVGKQFDALVVDPHCEGSPFELFGPEQTADPMDAFQKFIFLGDDRNIEQVYVAGREVKPGASGGRRR